MFLLDVTSHLVEAHAKCFGAFPVHVAGEDSVGGCIVSIDWSGKLQMAHLNQNHADVISVVDFWSRTLKVNILHASVMFGR